MKLCFFNTYYHPYNVGGAEISVQLLAEELVSQGYEVVVISLGEKPETRVINGVKIYYLEVKNLYLPATYDANILQKAMWHTFDSYNPFYGKSLTKIIRQERPDLIHTHNISGFSVKIWDLLKARFDLPIIHTLRDYYLLCPRGRMYENDKRCQSQCRVCSLLSIPKKKKSKNVDCVTGISSFVLDRHIQNGYFTQGQESRVIPNPVDINSITPSDLSSKDEISLGFLGRLEPSKGIELLLEKVSAMSKPVKLLVGGKGETEYVKELIKTFESDNINFLGYVDPDNFFSQVDYLVVPSLWEEPFGRVVIEAYAAGVPVIGSKRGGIADLIEENKTGWLFDPEQGNEFMNILKNLENGSTKLYHELRANCIEKAKSYDSKQIAGSYMDLYSQTYK